jgi:hypothetical protein
MKIHTESNQRAGFPDAGRPPNANVQPKYRRKQ